MKLRTMRIKNFCCFEDLELSFDESLSVLVGVNASGKSSIIKAASIAIGSFMLGIKDMPSVCIGAGDVRHTTGRLGTLMQLEPQFPAEIRAEGFLQGEHIAWARQRKSRRGTTTTAEARQISRIASRLYRQVVDGDARPVLPLIAAYGTDRVASKISYVERFGPSAFSRFDGYSNCLDTRSSERYLIAWMKRLAQAEAQNMETAPERQAVRHAACGIYNGEAGRARSELVAGGGFRAFDFRYNLADERLEFVLGGDGEKQLVPYGELSDGYRSVIGLVADIASRMGKLNPHLAKGGEMLQTPGVVLIDEIDQHLHPSWQQHVLQDLRDTFPNVQFIVTTHSPSIINSVAAKHLIVLDGQASCRPLTETYGRDAGFILTYVLGVPARPKAIMEQFDEFYSMLDREELKEAESKLDEIGRAVGEDDPEVSRERVSLELELLD